MKLEIGCRVHFLEPFLTAIGRSRSEREGLPFVLEEGATVGLTSGSDN